MANSILKKTWVVYIIFLVGFAITCISTYFTSSYIEYRDQQKFILVCSDIETKIATRLHAHAQLLRSGAAFFSTSENITRSDWKYYFEKSKINISLPGIQGLGFAQIIPENKLQQHINNIRDEGFPDYNLRPIIKSDLITSITYLEPFDARNKRAFGYNMFSEPVRRLAMEQARDYDISALSGKVLLVQETQDDLQAGTLMYVPVYKRNSPVNTLEDRRRAIIGWVYSPYRMDDLMFGIIGQWDFNIRSQIYMKVFDEYISEQNLLFDSQKSESLKLEKMKLRTAEVPVSFNGKKWVLQFHQIKERSPYFKSNVMFVFFGSFIINILLFFLLASLFNTSQSAKIIADKLTSKLKESEGKFRALADTSPLAIYMSTGVEQKAVYINHTFTKLFGYKMEEVPTVEKWWPLAYPDESYRNQLINEWQNKVELAIKTKTQIEPMEVVVTCKDGSTKNISWGFITIGKQNWAFGLDLTQRFQAEQLLKESEEKFRTIFMDAPLGIALIHSKNGNIIEANPKYEKIVGRSIEELGKIDWMSISHPDDIQADLDNMDLLNSGKINNFKMEKRYIHKNGAIIWINMTIAPLLMKDKDNPQHLCIVEDITALKSTQQQLLDTNQSLEEMVYIASHDLQVPLISMEGYASELLEDYGRILDENGRFCLERLKANAQNMHKLVLSLLDISRLNTKKIQFDYFSLNQVIEKVVMDLSLTIQKEKASVTWSDLPQIFGDRQRIEVVFRNLISNALNYEGKNITLGINDNIIFIKDDGIGIPPGQLEIVFNPGERLKINDSEGVGMGLTFCKKVIEQHHWKIWAESTGSHGTVFKIDMNI